MDFSIFYKSGALDVLIPISFVVFIMLMYYLNHRFVHSRPHLSLARRIITLGILAAFYLAIVYFFVFLPMGIALNATAMRILFGYLVLAFSALIYTDLYKKYVATAIKHYSSHTFIRFILNALGILLCIAMALLTTGIVIYLLRPLLHLQ